MFTNWLENSNEMVQLFLKFFQVFEPSLQFLFINSIPGNFSAKNLATRFSKFTRKFKKKYVVTFKVVKLQISSPLPGLTLEYLKSSVYFEITLKFTLIPKISTFLEPMSSIFFRWLISNHFLVKKGKYNIFKIDSKNFLNAVVPKPF